MVASSQQYFLFIGTYTGTGSKGIYVYQFDVPTGKLTPVSHTENVENPSYLAIAPGDTTVYACNEVASSTGGQVSAFRFDRQSGKLIFLNKQATGGDHPAYIAVDNKNKWLIAGNYSGGSIAAFPIQKDGSLSPYTQLIKHTGKSVNDERQTSPHVHATVFSPHGDYLFAPDLGIDKVMAYRFRSASKNPLVAASPAFVKTTPGSGPRHFDFHPNGKWAYLIEELTGSVVAYRYSKGKLAKMQRVFAHDDTATGPFLSADIHVSPDGQFLYASNRSKENNIAIFKIDQRTGVLSLVGYESTRGVMPRNFCIDPSGNFLLAANQGSDNIVVFKRDVVTGKLTYTGEEVRIPKPVCLKMIK